MLLKNIKYVFQSIIDKSLDPEKAYNIWADIYDSDNDNLVFRMEEEILDSLMVTLNLSGKLTLDYGCGTGRNWKRLLKYNAGKIIGCDISQKMLEKLKNKYTEYETYLIKKNSSLPVKTGTIDFIFSTLVIAQINNLKKTFHEWDRLIKPGGLILLTDLHPDILSAGGKRTFEKNGKVYEIKNYIHSIGKIKKLCESFNMEIVGFKERFILEDSKDFYENKNALYIYDKFYGLPLVYGILIRK
ncbi:MAG: class I SAM-dependent methyltransferase [Ignavibacteriaceae bacterium]